MFKSLYKETEGFRLVSILTPLCMIGEVVMEMIIPKLMSSIIDDGVTAGNLSHIYRIGGWMIVAAAFGLLFGVLGGVFGARASTGYARNLRRSMYRNIQTFSFANIDKYSTAGLVTRMTTDVTNIQNAYQMILRMAIRAPSSMVIAMIMAFTINAKLASIYLVAVIILGGCLIFIMSRASNYFSAAFKKYDDLNESVQENVSAIRVVKAYVREDYESEKFKKASGNVQDLLLRAEKVLSFNSPLMMATVYTCILLISWLGARMIVLSGATSFTTGELMSMLTYCTNILTSLMMLSMVFIMISMSAASAKRVAEVLEEESTLSNGKNPVMEVKNGAVRFDHVCFRYKADGRDVLSDINLNIRSGETIGIIGGTGSSKSTLIQLISRLYDATEGAVRVGGVDVRSYDLEALRDQVAVVLQKNVLFSGSIRENGVNSKRYQGYCEAMQAAGLCVSKDALYLGTVDHEYGQQAAESYVRRGKRQTAAFVTADILAMGFIKGLMEHNVRVPEEMSIVGFDDVYLAQMCYPSLTTVNQDIARKGQLAVQCILDTVENPGIGRIEHILPLTLTERDSVKERSAGAC
mgnify:CR=1 FL=1